MLSIFLPCGALKIWTFIYLQFDTRTLWLFKLHWFGRSSLLQNLTIALIDLVLIFNAVNFFWKKVSLLCRYAFVDLCWGVASIHWIVRIWTRLKSAVMKQTQEIWLESSSLPTGVRSPQQWLQAGNFLRTHCSICSFKQGWVWWVANLILKRKGKSQKKESRHTRYVSMHPLQICESRNFFRWPLRRINVILP